MYDRTNAPPARTALKEWPLSVDSILNIDALLETFQDRKRTHGDRVDALHRKLSDITAAEMAHTLRILLDHFRKTGHLLKVTREQRIPKSRGGFRTLRLQDAATNLLAAHAYRIIAPRFEMDCFLPLSIGFRPGCSPWILYRALQQAARTQDQLWIAQADIRDAFGSVEIAAALQGLTADLGEEFREILTPLIRGSSDRQDYHRTHGLDQGDPFSPFVLNHRLHGIFDVSIQEAPETLLWYRYADNLFACGSSRDAAEKACRRMQDSFRDSEFRLHDIRVTGLCNTARTEVLGLRAGVQDRKVTFRTTPQARRELESRVGECWYEPDPLRQARHVIRSWILSYGPACEKRTDSFLLNEITGIVFRCGVCEGIPEELISHWLDEASDKWTRYVAGKTSVHADGVRTTCVEGEEEGRSSAPLLVKTNRNPVPGAGSHDPAPFSISSASCAQHSSSGDLQSPASAQQKSCPKKPDSGYNETNHVSCHS